MQQWLQYVAGMNGRMQFLRQLMIKEPELDVLRCHHYDDMTMQEHGEIDWKNSLFMEEEIKAFCLC